MNDMLLLARYMRRKNKGSNTVPQRQNPTRLARLFKRRNKPQQ